VKRALAAVLLFSFTFISGSLFGQQVAQQVPAASVSKEKTVQSEVKTEKLPEDKRERLTKCLEHRRLELERLHKQNQQRARQEAKPDRSDQRAK